MALAAISIHASPGMDARRRACTAQGSSGTHVCKCTCTKLAHRPVIDTVVHNDTATAEANRTCMLDPPVCPVIRTAPVGRCSTKCALMRAHLLHVRRHRVMALCTRIGKSAEERCNRTASVKTAGGPASVRVWAAQSCMRVDYACPHVTAQPRCSRMLAPRCFDCCCSVAPLFRRLADTRAQRHDSTPACVQ